MARQQEGAALDLTRAQMRLRASPAFVQALTMDGRAYIAKETEPYTQYWLNERYRRLLTLYSARQGASLKKAMTAYARLSGKRLNAAEKKRLTTATQDMLDCGVLITAEDDVSRYDSAIVAPYLTHRPFPPEVTQAIVRNGGVTSQSAVLDLAGGPGDLAVQLAAVSDYVEMMELSKGFVEAAEARAAAAGLSLTAVHDSCNRLVFHGGAYDAITVSQALHWLDDVMVCKGVCRVLNRDGSFFVIHSAFEVPPSHPLAYLLGAHSILGHQIAKSFPQQVEPLLRRLTLLFDALDAPDVHRVDLAQDWSAAHQSETSRIVPQAVQFFRQQRVMGEGFARAFLTPQHIAVTGMQEAAFWQDLQQRCSSATQADLMGRQDWALLQFKRGGSRLGTMSLEDLPVSMIGCSAPVEGL